MKYTLRFSNSVVQDMENVLAYTQTQFGEQKHSEYVELIRLALSDLAANPLTMGSKDRSDILQGVRTFHIERRGKRARHLFVYRFVDSFIDLARLLHDSMDLDERLPEAFDALK